MFYSSDGQPKIRSTLDFHVLSFLHFVGNQLEVPEKNVSTPQKYLKRKRQTNDVTPYACKLDTALVVDVDTLAQSEFIRFVIKQAVGSINRIIHQTVFIGSAYQ